MAEWQIEESLDRATFDVTVDGRQVQYDCIDFEEALEVVAQEFQPGDSLVHLEPDGYRRDMDDPR